MSSSPCSTALTDQTLTVTLRVCLLISLSGRSHLKVDRREFSCACMCVCMYVCMCVSCDVCRPHPCSSTQHSIECITHTSALHEGTAESHCTVLLRGSGYYHIHHTHHITSHHTKQHNINSIEVQTESDLIEKSRDICSR